MDFLTTPPPTAGPPPMDLEEPADAPVPCDSLTPTGQWDPESGSPGHMELDGPGLRDLVRHFEALPGNLGDLAPDAAPCPLHVATGLGQASQGPADAHGLLSAEAGRDDLLSLLRCDSAPSLPGPQGLSEPPLYLLQPPEDPPEEPIPPEWTVGAAAEGDGSRSSSSSPEPWLETVPLVGPEEPRAGTQVGPTLPCGPRCPGIEWGPLSAWFLLSSCRALRPWPRALPCLMVSVPATLGCWGSCGRSACPCGHGQETALLVGGETKAGLGNVLK